MLLQGTLIGSVYEIQLLPDDFMTHTAEKQIKESYAYLIKYVLLYFSDATRDFVQRNRVILIIA
jgi:hypothetical protein